jgi:hypothetical protein
MFDVDSFSMADAMADSPDYKIIRSGTNIYVFPSDADFEALAGRDQLGYWLDRATIMIDHDGIVRTNRFGIKSRNAV